MARSLGHGMGQSQACRAGQGDQMSNIKMYYLVRSQNKLLLYVVLGLAMTNLTYLLASNLWAQHCVPHSELLQVYGPLQPCDNSHFIVDCVDPYQSYLTDPKLLSSCGLMGNNPVTAPATPLRDQIKRAPGRCKKEKDILLSFILVRHKPKRSHPQTEALVPNVVHYISLGCQRVFKFHDYLSIFSVHRFIQPEKILFHGDCPPRGEWWARVLEEVPNIYFRNRTRLKLIQGRRPMWVSHETDVFRLQILFEEGGIYLDSDVLILAPIDDLRKHPVSMGREDGTKWKLCGAFIMAQPKTPFVCLWLHAFREYAPRSNVDWGTYAVKTPANIAMVYPERLHIEDTRFFRPNSAELVSIYRGFYDWSNKYMVHLWQSSGHFSYTLLGTTWEEVVPQSPAQIPQADRVQNSLQEIFRHICFNHTVIRAKGGRAAATSPCLSKCIDVHHN